MRLDVPHVARNCDLLWFWNIILPIQITNWEPTPQFEVDIEVQIAPCANVGQELLGIQPDEKVRTAWSDTPRHGIYKTLQGIGSKAFLVGGFKHGILILHHLWDIYGIYIYGVYIIIYSIWIDMG